MHEGSRDRRSIERVSVEVDWIARGKISHEDDSFRVDFAAGTSAGSEPMG
jgi:hypothetical protein